MTITNRVIGSLFQIYPSLTKNITPTAIRRISPQGPGVVRGVKNIPIEQPKRVVNNKPFDQEIWNTPKS